MALNPRTWYPIAALGAFVNVVAFAFAAASAEPWHATTHAVLATAFWLWAQRIKARPGVGALEGVHEAAIAALREEVLELRREVSEMQERLDFAERLLSQVRDRDQLPGRPPDDRG